MKAERGTGTPETRRHRLDFISSHFLANRKDSPKVSRGGEESKQTNGEPRVINYHSVVCERVYVCVRVGGVYCRMSRLS